MPETGVGITIEAQGNADAKIDKVTKSAGLFSKKFEGMGKSVGALPDKLGKASTSLLLLQNSTSQMSGQMADALNKITAVAGLVATGGPLGIAIGAMTAGVALGTAAWESMTAQVRHAEAALNALESSTLAKLGTRIDTTTAKIKELQKQLKHWGKTQDEINQSTTKETIESLERNLPLLRTELKLRELRIFAIKQELAATTALGLKTGIYTEETIKAANALREELSGLEESNVKMAVAIPKLERMLALKKQQAEELGNVAGKLKAEEASQKAQGEGADLLAENALRALRQRTEGMEQDAAIEFDLHNRKMAMVDEERTRRNATIDSITAKRQAQRDFELGALDAVMAKEEERAERQKELQATVAESASRAFESIISASGEAKDEAIKNALALGAKEVTIAAVKTWAHTIEAFSKLGPFGVALGTAAGAAAFTLVKGLMSKFDTGGIARSPTGQSHVPILVQAGKERVLDERQTINFERLTDIADRLASGGGAGGGMLTLNATVTDEGIEDRDQRRRKALLLGREMEDLVSVGALNFGAA